MSYNMLLSNHNVKNNLRNYSEGEDTGDKTCKVSSPSLSPIINESSTAIPGKSLESLTAINSILTGTWVIIADL